MSHPVSEIPMTDNTHSYKNVEFNYEVNAPRVGTSKKLLVV